MQSREEEYRKSLIEELENRCIKEAEPKAIQLLKWKIQLLKGVDEPSEYANAKAVFSENKANSSLLAFLLYEGIFSNYKDLYQCEELGTLDQISQTAGEYMESVPAMGALTGPVLISAAIVGGVKGLFQAKTKVPLNQTSLIEFFCNLEKIRNPGPRKVFIEMVSSVCEKYLTAIKLDTSFKSTEDIHAKWLNLLCYVADISNYGTGLYRTIINISEAKKERQDRLGFRSLYSFFKRCDALPDEVHELIRDKYIALSR